MAVDNIYSALVKVLAQNTNISSPLATYPNSAVKIIQPGVLAEQVTGRPAITLRSESMGRIDYIYGNETFIVNHFAIDEITSGNLARTTMKELDDTNITIDGFSMRFAVNGIGSFVDPTAKEINTPVSIRVVYWRT